jgi:hypothetical protein
VPIPRSALRVAFAFTSVLAAAPVASAAIVTFTASLSGPNEEPPNNSPGIGDVIVDFDTTLVTMRVRATFSGLLGTVTNAHIHAATTVPFAGTAGVATQSPTFPGFPSGVTSGSYDQTFDMTLVSSYNAPFLTANGGSTSAAFAALLNASTDGRAYFNIHSSLFGPGEIRGFLVPVPGGLAILALAGIAGARRRR